MMRSFVAGYVAFRSNSLQVLALGIMVALGPSLVNAQSAIQKTPPANQAAVRKNTPLSSGQKVWLEHVQSVKESDKCRAELLKIFKEDIDKQIRRLLESADYMGFADSVLGLYSKLQMTNGEGPFRNYIAEEFKSYVFRPLDLELHIENRAKQFTDYQSEITDMLLVTYKTDTKVDFKSITIPTIQIPNLKSSLQSVIHAAEDKAWESVESFAVSLGAGAVAGQAAQGMFAPTSDPNADAFTQLFNSAVAMAIDFAAGLAVDAVVNEVYQTDAKLIEEVKSSMELQLLPLLSTNAQSASWRVPFEQHVQVHRDACLDAICQALKIDRAWAESTLK